MSEGLAETVKHACLGDAQLFGALEQFFVVDHHTVQDFVEDPTLRQYVARRNCEIKRDFVTQDVHEDGLRMVLNLGHTFGRAIEAAAGHRLNHGEAVAIGLTLQAQWGERRGHLTADDTHRIVALLEAVDLPVRIPEDIADDDIVRKMFLDKKVRRGEIRMVFQEGIGDYARGGSVAVAEADVRELLATVRG